MALGLAARIAVLVFFVLSGYVIAASLAANISRAGEFDAEKYVLSRAFRVVPPLLLAIALPALLALLLRWSGADHVSVTTAARPVYQPDVAAQLLSLFTLCTHGDLTGAYANGPLWSLAFEIRLYVVAGLLAFIFHTRRWLPRAVACYLLWEFASSIRLGVVTTTGLNLQAVAFAAFFFGTVAYRLRGARALHLLVTAALFAGLAAYRVSQVPGSILASLELDLEPNLLAAETAVAGGAAALLVLVARMRRWRVFRGAGEYSYTLYICHFPLLLAGYFALANTWAAPLRPAYSALTATIAMLAVWIVLARLGRWIERPHVQRDRALQLGALLRGARLPAGHEMTSAFGR